MRLYYDGGGGKNSTTTVKNERSSNIELYRIIVMFLIVAHHYFVNSGLRLFAESEPLCMDTWFYIIFCAWGKTGINCFVLITGYFMCKSHISLRKFLKLYMWVITYCTIISALFIITGYESLSLRTFANYVLIFIPIRHLTSNDFVSCYLLFFLFIPFLNILINNITRRQHLSLIALLLFIYTLHGSIPKIAEVSMNYISWFSTLYLISSYLRLYPLSIDKNTKLWGYLTLLSWSLSIISVVLLTLLQSGFLNELRVSISYFFISDSNAVLALTNGITSFMWFKNLQIKNSRIINTVAASSFGVLLIHANSDVMRRWLWRDMVDCVGHFHSTWFYCIGVLVLIYTVCTLIDIIRRCTIENKILDIIERICIKTKNKLYRIYD